jgi:hypothetical protein
MFRRALCLPGWRRKQAGQEMDDAPSEWPDLEVTANEALDALAAGNRNPSSI